MNAPLRIAGVAVFFATTHLAGQVFKPAAAKESAAVKNWAPSRTPDGQPDLQGVWTNSTLTPLERPAQFAGKPTLTQQEADEYVKSLLYRVNSDRRDGGAQVDVNRSYNEFWRDRGNELTADRRTSLIVDPPDGKIPALTPEAQKRSDDDLAWRREHVNEGPESFGLWERCIVRGLPMVPGPYNNDFQILQTRGSVVILMEMIHDARVIPLDGRPHAPSGIRQWMGDSRGRWEGNTLVVETTNFSPKFSFHGSDANLHLVERFTRVDPETIRYEFTVDDPTAFTRSWTVRVPMRKTPERVFEYACSEGNYALSDILAGARAQEKKAAGGGK